MTDSSKSSPPEDSGRGGSTFFWTAGGGLFALAMAIFAGTQAAERHSAPLWTATAVLVVAALLSFTGALLKRHRRLKSKHQPKPED